MPKSTDLIGKQFGSLTVVEKLTKRVIKGVERKGIWWRSSCTCGGEAISNTHAIMNSVRKCQSCVSNSFHNKWIGSKVSSKNYGDFIVLSIEKGKAEIEFIKTGFRTLVDQSDLKGGNVKDLFLPTVAGVGFMGLGEYASRYTTPEGKIKNTPAYEVWNGMLKRCYNSKWREKQCRNSYKDVTVSAEWHNFQNFAKWFENNKPEYDNFALDKDLKIIGNRVYSSEACTFVPVAVNSLFTGTEDNRELPRGVHYCNNKQKYVVQVHIGDTTKTGLPKQTYFGVYADRVVAIDKYKTAKTEHCKIVAEKYKDVLDPTVYFNLSNNAMKFIE